MKNKLSFTKIPYLNLPDTAIVASSQEHLPIADICDDIVLYKDGGAALIMQTTSLNFGLLSEKEQEAVIFAYAALLNSLSFPIQIFIHSQQKDLTNYLKYFDQITQRVVNPKLSSLTQSYRRFITESIKKKNVLEKKFYIVIPFSQLELGIAKSTVSIVRKGSLPFPKSYVIKKAKIILYPKRDHLIRQSSRFGIKLRQLTSSEIIDLYYDIYNPDKPYSKKEQIGL